MGSAAQLSCPVGSYCSTPSLPATPCTANSYCSSTSTNVCPGNTVSPPYSSTYLSCTCPAGYYGSVTSPTTSNCALCELGNYCPVGSVAQEPCPVGWYCPTPSLAVICSNKPTALSYIGTGGTSATCPFGDTPSCPAGQYADITTKNCLLCEAGTYQPTAVTYWPSFLGCAGIEWTFTGQMSGGQNVYSGGGYYLWYYNNYLWIRGYTIGGNLGWSCSGSPVTFSLCPLCPVGSYCPASGLSVTQTCPAGSYCPVPGAATPCPEGSYCPEGSIVATPCTANSFCSSTSTNVCPGNTVSPPLSSTYLNCTCPAGYSGSVSGITTSNCALCVQGEYCPGSSQSCNC